MGTIYLRNFSSPWIEKNSVKTKQKNVDKKLSEKLSKKIWVGHSVTLQIYPSNIVALPLNCFRDISPNTPKTSYFTNNCFSPLDWSLPKWTHLPTFKKKPIKSSNSLTFKSQFKETNSKRDFIIITAFIVCTYYLARRVGTVAYVLAFQICNVLKFTQAWVVAVFGAHKL